MEGSTSAASHPSWTQDSKLHLSGSVCSRQSITSGSGESGTLHRHYGSKPSSRASSRRGSASSISSSDNWCKYLPPDAADPSFCSVPRRRIFPVEFSFFLYTFSLSLFIELYQQYYFQQISMETLRNVTNQASLNRSECFNQEYIVNLTNNQTFQDVQRETSQFNIYTQIILYMTSSLVTLLVGPMSDVIGRKPFTVVIVCGLLIAAVGQVVIIHFHFSIWFFMAAAFVLSLPGGLGGMLTLCAASIRDGTSDQWLTLRMGFLEAGLFFARSLGSVTALNWMQASSCDFSLLSWMMIGVGSCTVLYVLLVPESVEKDNVLRMSNLCCCIASQLLNSVKVFLWPPYIGFHRFWKVVVAEVVICVAMFNLMGLLQIQNYFLLHLPLEWPHSLVGIYGAVNSAVHGTALILLIPVLTIARLPDPLVGLVGVLFAAAASVAIANIQTTWEMFLGIVTSVLVNTTSPIFHPHS